MWVSSAKAVFLKELRSEWLTRSAIGSTALFAVSMLAAIGYSLALHDVAADVKASLLWLVLMFAAITGSSRLYTREVELGTHNMLRLAGNPTAVHAGKAAFALVLIGLVQSLATALFFVVLPVDPATFDTSLFVELSVLGAIGLAASTSFVAALVAPGTTGGARSAVFFVTAFPIILPLLLLLVKGTMAAFAPSSLPIGTGHACVELIGAFDAIIISASFLLIGHVIDG
jgi:heme exporter protein B